MPFLDASQFVKVLAGAPCLLLPTHYGMTEPIRAKFELEYAERQLASLWTSAGDSIDFVSRGRLRGFGSCTTERSAKYRSVNMAYDYESVLKHGLFEEFVGLYFKFLAMPTLEVGWCGIRALHPGGGWNASTPEVLPEINGTVIHQDDTIAFEHGSDLNVLAWLTAVGDPSRNGPVPLADLKSWSEYLFRELTCGARCFRFTESPEQMHDPRVRERLQLALHARSRS